MNSEINHCSAASVSFTHLSPTAPPPRHMQMTNTTTTTTKPLRKRLVTFQATCAVVVVPSHHDYTDEEYHNSWYDEDEQDDFMAANIETIRALRHGCDDQSEHACGRGLEAMIHPEVLEQRKLDMASVVDAVLREHRRQNDLGLYDPEKIGRASRHFSASSVERAISFALDDARFVRKEVAAERRVRSSMFDGQEDEKTLLEFFAKIRTMSSLGEGICGSNEMENSDKIHGGGGSGVGTVTRT